MTTGRKVWRYDGTWTEIDDPITWERDGEPCRDAYQRAGYEPADSWGWPGMEEAEIYERKRQLGEPDRWLIDYCANASDYRTILVEGLPNLIELSSKLASITTAVLLTGVTRQLESLVYNAAEDSQRERDRRYPRSAPRLTAKGV